MFRNRVLQLIWKHINVPAKWESGRVWKDQQSCKPTCVLGSFSCKGEVGSSRMFSTFLLFRIWSSFFAFRSSMLTSALLRRSSWRCPHKQTLPPLSFSFVLQSLLFIDRTYVCIFPFVFELVESSSGVGASWHSRTVSGTTEPSKCRASPCWTDMRVKRSQPCFFPTPTSGVLNGSG